MNTEQDKTSTEGIIFGEGPTFMFTINRGERHPFYHDMDCLIEEGKTKQLNDYMTLLRRHNVVRLHTTFEPMDYFNKEEFYKWWNENNVDGEIKDKYSDWDSTLVRLDDDTFEIVDDINFYELEEYLK